MTTNGIADEVKEWLEKEDIQIAPYLRAWQGKDPYECLNDIRLGFQMMCGACVGLSLFVLLYLIEQTVAAFIVASLATGCILISAFGLGFYIRKQEKKKLDHFIRAVQWCRIHDIPLAYLGKKDWTKETIERVLWPICGIIRDLIIPLEETLISNKVFPKRRTEAESRQIKEKARVVEVFRTVAPLFGNFQGVKNPVSMAYQIASLR